ncbi:hypothetical protein Tco_0029009, partial [Tanacetum coccineum]
TIRDTIAHTRSKNVTKDFNDPMLTRVLDLETTKTTQGNEIVSLKRRVKKLKRRNRSRPHKLKRLHKELAISKSPKLPNLQPLFTTRSTKKGRKAIFKLSEQMSIVKAVFKKTKPVNYMDNFLLLNLRTMFEHHVEDNSIPYYLLVEKMYPLTEHTLHYMFNDVKLQVDYECEMAFELLRLVKKRVKEGYVPE